MTTSPKTIVGGSSVVVFFIKFTHKKFLFHCQAVSLKEVSLLGCFWNLRGKKSLVNVLINQILFAASTFSKLAPKGYTMGRAFALQVSNPDLTPCVSYSPYPFCKWSLSSKSRITPEERWEQPKNKQKVLKLLLTFPGDSLKTFDYQLHKNDLS